MDAAEYEAMDNSEAWMWWYRALHRNMLHLLQQYLTLPDPVILDAGCGTGQFLLHLERAFPRATLVGLDVNEPACRRARQKSGKMIVNASINQLPVADGRVDAIIAADVLYHALVEEAVALRQLVRCLKPGGLLLVNLPAFEWMRSTHDRRVHGARRYTLPGARLLLRQAGLTILGGGYWNSLLFALMAARRKLLPAGKASDVGQFDDSLNRVFDGICRLEHGMMRRGLRFPFGGSVLILAVKA